MIDKNMEALISIVRAGLCGEKAEIPEEFNTELLYAFAKKHRAANLIFHGAFISGMDENSPVMQKLYVAAVGELSFHERQAKEIEEIFSLFEEQKIS